MNRMQLRQLDIQGFKSFARPTSFVFHDGMTALIGPNGAGKSCVADAIRWVLGEQSIKSLRGRSSADVIFAGNDWHRPAGMAKVALTFDNEAGRFGMDAPQITITRIFTRDGEGEYLINNDPVRLVDMQRMLAEAGMGVKSYTVISQGMVDQYLTASPQGRRELFDEATGVKALQIKLKQAQQKLAQAEIKKSELAIILDELKPRLTVLNRQVMRQVKRERLEKEHKELQRLWYHKTWYEMSRRIDHLLVKEEHVNVSLLEARQERERTEAMLLAAADEARSGPIDERAQLERELLDKQQAFERGRMEYEKLKKRRDEIETALQKVETARREAERELDQARATLTDSSYSAGQNDFFIGLKNILEECRAALEHRDAMIHDDGAIDVLLGQIDDSLEQLSKEDTILAAAQSVLGRLEGPLQAVARLRAIEGERREQLGHWLVPKKPAEDELNVLRKRLAEVKQRDKGEKKKANFEEMLSRVRAAELEAERADEAVKIARQQAGQDLANIEAEIRREAGTIFLQQIQHESPPPKAGEVTEDTVRKVAARLSTLGEIDPLALQEYEETQRRHDDLKLQLDDAVCAMEDTHKIVRSLDRSIERQFKENFVAINDVFGHYFSELFGGGTAQLEIVAEDPVEGKEMVDDQEIMIRGVEIGVKPPKKKPSHVHLLSGGEKALTSLALVLAIMRVQKPPFLVLDEVDAALDESNSWRFSQLLRELKEQTQVVLITHNRETMGQADMLYGITMQAGVSDVYSVKMEGTEKSNS